MSNPSPAPAGPIVQATNIAASLIASGFDATTTAQALVDPAVYPTLSASDLVTVMMDPRVVPSLTRDTLTALLTATNHYTAADVSAAADARFPPVPVAPTAVLGNDAFQLAGGAYLFADHNGAYQFGSGDFTVEAMVKSTAPGTLVGFKGTAGMSGDGGFLLVAQSGGSLKLATDNGFDFYEIDAPAGVLDGQWHHVAAVRQGQSLTIYVDGQPRPGSNRGNAGAAPLNINNSERLTIGTVDQVQEPFRALTGLLAEIRLWRVARSQADVNGTRGTRLPTGTANLVGYWSGEFGLPLDLSATNAATHVSGAVGTSPDGPPVFAGVQPVTGYAGVYDTATKFGGTSGTWQDAGPLYVFASGNVVFGNRALVGATVAATTMTWPGAGNAGTGTVHFLPASSETYFWPQGPQRGPVFQGAYTPGGGSGALDFRGARR